MREIRRACNYKKVWEEIQPKMVKYESVKDMAGEKYGRLTITRVMKRYMSDDEYREYVHISQMQASKWDPNIFGPWIEELIKQKKTRVDIQNFFSERKITEENEDFAKMRNNELKYIYVVYCGKGNKEAGEMFYGKYIEEENRKIASWKRFGKIIPDLIKDLKENKLSLGKISVKYGRIADITIKKLRDDFFPEVAITYEEKKEKYKNKIVDLFIEGKKITEIRASFEPKLPYVFTRSVLEEEFGKEYFRERTLYNSIWNRAEKKKNTFKDIKLRYKKITEYLNKKKEIANLRIPEYLLSLICQIEFFIKNNNMKDVNIMIEKINKQNLTEDQKLAIQEMIKRIKKKNANVKDHTNSQ